MAVAGDPISKLLSLWFVPLVGLAVLVVIAALVRLIGRQRRMRAGEAGYEAQPALLTAAERSFFGVLQQAVGGKFQVFAKVRLADVVRPSEKSSQSAWQAAFNRVCGKHVDFVLCDPATLRVLAVIELDDRTHERFERGARDAVVDAALFDAGIPVVRVPARAAYSVSEVRVQVENLLRIQAEQKR
jgi:hypothetical protein